MKTNLLVLFLLVSGTTLGKTTYILADKLPANQQNDTYLRFVMEQEKYVPVSSRQGATDGNNATLRDGFVKAYDFFRQQDASNPELNLLLGDIASCLHRLSGGNFLETAEKYYKTAQQLAPLDYRAFWFMGNLYASVNEVVQAVGYFKMAQSRLPQREPSEFWEQFAQVANAASMPSTSLFAMDKAKSASGRMSEYERMYGSSVRNRILESSSLRSYTNKELWSYTETDKVIFTSRPLGLRVGIEPDWELDISDFDRKTATFTIQLSDENDTTTTYQMSITAKSVAESDDLKDFLNGFLPAASNKSDISFSDKYPGSIAYEVIGDKHSYLIGIRRKQPLYPGMSLDVPHEKPSNEPIRGRFAGTLFYAVRLDAPESVFPIAKKVFWDWFVNQLMVE